MADQIFIQRRFTIIDPNTGYEFTDAIMLPEDDYNILSDDQIEAIKQQRFTAWKIAILTPAQEVSPSDQLASIDDQIASLTEQLDQLSMQQETVKSQLLASPAEVQPSGGV